MNNDQIYLIERYVSDLLTPEERTNFESHLESDPEFKTAYEDYLMLNNLMQAAGRIDLQSKLDQFETEVVVPKKQKVIPLWIKRALPAAAVIVVMFGIYQYYFANQGITGNELYSDYFETYAAPATLRSGDSNAIATWNEAMKYYEQEDFTKASELISEVENGVPDTTKAFYSAMAQLGSGSPDMESILKSLDLVLTADNDYQEQAKWYKALVLLKMGEPTKARELLYEISQSGGYMKDAALEIVQMRIVD